MHAGVDLQRGETGDIGLRGWAGRIENRKHGVACRKRRINMNTVIKYSIFPPATHWQFPGLPLWLCSAYCLSALLQASIGVVCRAYPGNYPQV